MLDGLASLVEKSLLRQRADADGEPRFWMLETIREYALEVLERTGGLEDGRRRHADYYASVAEQLDVESRTGDQASSLARLDDDNPNLRAALDWAREIRDGDLTLRLASSLWGFWATRGHVAEGRKALDDALELSGKRPARALLGLCTLRILSADTRACSPTRKRRSAPARSSATTSAWRRRGTSSAASREASWARLGQAEEAWRHGALVRRARRLLGREGGEHRLADDQRDLRVSAGRGGARRCKGFLESAGDDPATRAFCCVELAVLEAMSGDFEHARELLAEGTRSISELGLTVWAANNAQEAYYVEMLAGNPGGGGEHAPRELRDARGDGRARIPLDDRRLPRSRALRAGRVRRGRALQPSERGRAAPDDVMSQVLWRTARAKVRAERGDAESAEALAREAVRLAEGTELLNTQGDALLDLATVLTAAGRREEALAAAEEAAQRYEQKGNRALARASAAREARPGSWLDSATPGLNSRRIDRKGKRCRDTETAHEIPDHLAQYLARSALEDLPGSVYETLVALTPEELDLLESVGASLHAAGCESHSYASVIH